MTKEQVIDAGPDAGASESSSAGGYSASNAVASRSDTWKVSLRLLNVSNNAVPKIVKN